VKLQPPRSTLKPLVETRHDDVAVRSCDLARGGEVHGIVATQATPFGKQTRATQERLGDLDEREGCPVRVEQVDDTSQAPRVEASFPALAREGSTGLDLGDSSGRVADRLLEQLKHCVPPWLVHVQLHEGARVEAQNHRRSSTTRSETRRPLRLGRTAGR